MRSLFDIDLKDYDRNGSVFIRPSVRGIIIENGKIGMIHSLKYDYYKFPGGGIEKEESHVQALVREIQEETGLVVVPDTVKEYGFVHRVQKGDTEDMFVQDNYYYFCEIGSEVLSQHLDDYEAEERFTLEFIDPMLAIKTNQEEVHGPADPIMIERETRVLKLLLEEGCLDA